MADDGKPDDKPDVEPDDKPDTKPEETPDEDLGDADKLGDPGKKALEAMKRERNAARKEMNDLKARLKEFEDKDKTETQRLQETAEEAKSRAAKAETNARKLQTAIERAPEGASLAQIKAVAKRLHGESDEELEADADELFSLLAPSTQDTKKTLPGKPKENLSGGGDPGEEPEEKDPRKLADLIGRH
ncbi:hypothetical protein [Amycolatopsis sp. NPDC021455]|uniref:hypothetical protein n=1 Tax=Amycolatopsis sp. NPDC021455 TaxID=3154901 RepID=UPI0033ED02E7